ncbi:MAG: response regulator [Phaeospirillum sp.]|nr:response regulator [Phaeospirillum sp.]
MARILIIEDNPSNMVLFDFLLRGTGHDVLQAIDAEAGLVLARRERPDLILMDIQLPGMDGLTATRILKQDPATQDIKVLALTALAMKGDAEQILAHGCDGYIAKPIHHRSFLDEVGAALGAAAQGP